MNNLEYIRLDCKWCGFLNHFTIPILAKDVTTQWKCEKCNKFIIELHAKETD